MKTTFKFTIGDASTEAAFIANADGYDVAILTRYTPDSEPNLLPQHYLDGDQWQNLIDTIDSVRHLDEIVTAARALLTRAIAGLDQSATHDGLRNGQVIARMRAALENVAPPEPAAPEPTMVSPSGEEICEVCDGGPGNHGVCGCGFRAYGKPKPYAYAVKTAEGYVAHQGNQWWHESEPVGWALFSAEGLAESIAHTYQGEVVPVFKR